MSEPKIRLNQISPSTSGVDQISGNFSVSGNVGIGTTNPNANLSIGTDIGTFSGISVGAAANRDLRIGQGSANNVILGWKYNATPASAYATLETFGGGNPLALQSSGGNVGIGTTAPAYKLHVNNTAIAIQGASFPALKFLDSGGTANAEMYFGAGGGNDLNIVNYTSTGPIIAKTNNTERMRITSSGNIGIGVTNPNGKLQFGNDIISRKVVLYEGANNDYQFYGFGVLGATLLYNTYSVGDDHVFAVGTSSTTREELARINSTYKCLQIPGQPAFKTAWAGRNATGAGVDRILGTNQGDTLATGRDEFNQGGHYNTATGKFTCPVAGLYVFGISLMRNASNGTGIDVRIKKNGSNMWARVYASSYTSDYQQSMLIAITDAAVNDFFEFMIGPLTSIYNDDTYTFGYLIG